MGYSTYGISVLENSCQYCQREFAVKFPYMLKLRKYCSLSCALKDRHRKEGKSVILRCKYCGKQYKVAKYRGETGLFCSRNCKGKYWGQQIKTLAPQTLFQQGDKPWNAGIKGLVASANKGKTWEEIYGQDKAHELRARRHLFATSQIGSRNPFFGKKHSMESKRKISQACKGRISWNKGLTTSDSRLLIALKACHKKPNKKEKQLIEIIESQKFPFKFTGDGSVVIGGYIPDFTNINSRKQIIEFFGDYWHSKENIAWHQTELGRMMAYAQFGFRTLIIWEHELKDTEQVVSKIKQFTGS